MPSTPAPGSTPDPTTAPDTATSGRTAPDTTAPAAPSSAQRSLADAVREIEQHVARDGWDAAPRVFALVNARSALDADPSLADQLPPDVVAATATDPHHLLSVEQERLPPADDVEGLLAALSWPPTVDGAAIVVERIVLPPSAEQDLPTDPQAALEHLAAHPDRQDVRMAVGVLRDGTSWCALRSRAHDSDTEVGFGPDLVPGLVDGLVATFA